MAKQQNKPKLIHVLAGKNKPVRVDPPIVIEELPFPGSSANALIRAVSSEIVNRIKTIHNLHITTFHIFAITESLIEDRQNKSVPLNAYRDGLRLLGPFCGLLLVHDGTRLIATADRNTNKPFCQSHEIVNPDGFEEFCEAIMAFLTIE